MKVIHLAIFKQFKLSVELLHLCCSHHQLSLLLLEQVVHLFDLLHLKEKQKEAREVGEKKAERTCVRLKVEWILAGKSKCASWNKFFPLNLCLLIYWFHYLLSFPLLSLFCSTWPLRARTFLSLVSWFSMFSRRRRSFSCSEACCCWRCSCCFK